MWLLPFLVAGALMFGGPAGDDPIEPREPQREAKIIVDDGAPI